MVSESAHLVLIIHKITINRGIPAHTKLALNHQK